MNDYLELHEAYIAHEFKSKKQIDYEASRSARKQHANTTADNSRGAKMAADRKKAVDEINRLYGGLNYYTDDRLRASASLRKHVMQEIDTIYAKLKDFQQKYGNNINGDMTIMPNLSINDLQQLKQRISSFAHSDFGSTDYIAHYGVKGMKWGKHLKRRAEELYTKFKNKVKPNRNAENANTTGVVNNNTGQLTKTNKYSTEPLTAKQRKKYDTAVTRASVIQRANAEIKKANNAIASAKREQKIANHLNSSFRSYSRERGKKYHDDELLAKKKRKKAIEQKKAYSYRSYRNS